MCKECGTSVQEQTGNLQDRRELATISALAGMTGTAGQLRFHFGAAMNTGLTEPQMMDFISVLEAKMGRKEAGSANQVLTAVLQSRRWILRIMPAGGFPPSQKYRIRGTRSDEIV